MPRATSTVVNNALVQTCRQRIEAGCKSPFKLTVNFGPLEWESVGWRVDYQIDAGQSSSLWATNVRHFDTGGQLTIMGDVENRGAQTVTSPEVCVTLYDEDGRVINAARATLDVVLRPEDTVPFEIRFGQHVQDWATYDVQVDG